MVVSVAALCTHDKPWVRTMSRRVVRAILTDPISAMDNGLHAASAVVGQYIHQNLEGALGLTLIFSDIFFQPLKMAQCLLSDSCASWKELCIKCHLICSNNWPNLF